MIIQARLPDWLILLLWQGLIGEIYPEIRAISVGLSKDTHRLLIRYYLDRTPIDFDFESIDVVAFNISAALGLNSIISHIDVDCTFATDPVVKLDALNGFIYCRREYDI